MQKFKKNKRGFTLTELAIVIAVIAILVAVLVPTFISLMDKAEESSDMQLVSNLNTALSMEDTPDSVETDDGKVYNVTTAISSVRGYGYEVSKITPTSDKGDVVYNATKNKFVYYAENFTELAYGEVEDSDILVVIDANLSRVGLAEKVLSNAIQYCVYSEGAVSISTSADISIWLYTEGGTSTIDAKSSVVYRYGTGSSDEVAVADSSYHLYGSINVIDLKQGHVELTEKAVVEEVSITLNESATATLTVVGTKEELAISGDTSSENVTYQYKETDSSTAETKTVSELCEAAGSIQATTIENITGYGTKNNPYIAESVDALNAILGGLGTTITYIQLSDKVVTYTADIVIGSEDKNVKVVLDLNGKTITNSSSHTIYVYPGSALTLTGNGTVDNQTTGCAAIYNAGTVIIKNGSYTRTSNYWYTIVNIGTMTIESGTVQQSEDNASSLIRNGIYEDEASGDLTINDGYFSSVSTNAIKAEYGTLTINGGEFTNNYNGTSGIGTVIHLQYSTATVNSGIFEAVGNSTYAFGIAKPSTLTVNNAEIYYEISAGAFNGGSDNSSVYATYGTVVINNAYIEKSGSISGYFYSASLSLSIYNCKTNVSAKELNLEYDIVYFDGEFYNYTSKIPADGTYEAYGLVGNSATLTVTYYFKDVDDINISTSAIIKGTLYLSGEFDNGITIQISRADKLTIVFINDSASLGNVTFVSYNEGYEPVSTETTVNGYKAVNYISEMTENSAYAYAVVNGEMVYYADFASAVSNNAGGTIYLNKDLSTNTYFSITGSITIDLNGKTISSSGSNYGTLYINKADIEVVITDSGNGDGINSNSNQYAVYLGSSAYRSSLFVDSSVKLAGNINLYTPTANVYLYDTSVFIGTDYSVKTTVNNYKVSSANVTIDDSNIEWYYATAEDETSAEAYIVKNGVTIYYNSLSHAFRLNDTVYINKNITYTSSISVYGNVTIDLNGYTISSSSSSYTLSVTANTSVIITDSSTGDKGSVINTNANKIAIRLATGANLTIESDVTIDGYIYLYASGAVASVSDNAVISNGGIKGNSSYTLNTDTTSKDNYTIYSLI